MNKTFKVVFVVLIALLLSSGVLTYNTSVRLKKADNIIEQQAIALDEKDLEIEAKESRIEELENAEEHYKNTLEETEGKLKTCQSDLAKKN